MANFMDNFSDFDKPVLGSGGAKKSVKFNDDDDILDDLLMIDDDDFSKKPSSSETNKKLTDLFSIKPLAAPSSEIAEVKAMPSKTSSNENQRRNIIKSIMEESDKKPEERAKSSIDNKEEAKMSLIGDIPMPKSDKFSASVQSGFGNLNDASQRPNKSAEYSPPRRRRPQSARKGILDDPLGLFSTTGKSSLESEQINIIPGITLRGEENKSKRDDDLPWLSKNEQSSASERRKPLEAQPTLFSNVDTKLEFKETEIGTDQMSILTSMQKDTKATMSLFQQYEQLNNVLEQQRMQFVEREKQFEELVKKQIEGQALLDSQLKMQQGRMQNLLQTLLINSSPSATADFSGLLSKNNVKIENGCEAEILSKKLQIENIQLEKTLESVKQKHETEMSLLEESYKKQIQLLEETLEKVENRTRKDAEALEKMYIATIEQMKEKIQTLEKEHSEEKGKIMVENNKLLEETYERHSHNVELLQRELMNSIENISKAKNLESSAIDLITNRGKDVNKILDNSETIIDNLAKQQEQLQQYGDKLFLERGDQFKKQENELKILRESIQQEQSVLQDDRKNFIKITQNFQSEMSSIVTELRDKMVQLADSEINLRIREKSIARERELMMDQCRWEDANTKVTKDMWEKRREEQAMTLAEERRNISMEREQLQASSKLQEKLNQVEKAEIKSSMKAAKDAAESIIREKNSWQEKNIHVEIQRKMLSEKENQLIQQASYLEELTRLTLAKKNEGMEALRKAHRIEQKYKEKLDMLETQLEILEERENKIAAEKIALAEMKISLRMRNVEIPLVNKDSKYHKGKFTNSTKSQSMIQTKFKGVVDPTMVLLRINANNKLCDNLTDHQTRF